MHVPVHDRGIWRGTWLTSFRTVSSSANNIRHRTVEFGMQKLPLLLIPTVNSPVSRIIQPKAVVAAADINSYSLAMTALVAMTSLGCQLRSYGGCMYFFSRQGCVLMSHAWLLFFSEAQQKRSNVQSVES